MLIHGLYSKWPENTGFHTYYDKAKGVYIDGYLDMAYMGLGSSILGYCDSDVNKAVKKSIDRGSMSTLNCFEEECLYDLMRSMVPWMKSMRLAKCGGDAVYIAYKIASYFKGTKKYVTNGYCGWQLSHFDRNMEVENCHRIDFSDIEQLKAVPDDIDIYIIELARSEMVSKEWVNILKEKTKNKILIIDEITSGFRYGIPGVSHFYDIKPNFTIFGKAIANGYPLSVICGDEIMNMVKNDVFISSTMYSERIGIVAAIVTINKIIKYKVPLYISDIGKEYKKIFEPFMLFIKPQNVIVEMVTIPDVKKILTQYFYTNKVLFSDRFYPSLKHTGKHIKIVKRLFENLLNKTGVKLV